MDPQVRATIAEMTANERQFREAARNRQTDAAIDYPEGTPVIVEGLPGVVARQSYEDEETVSVTLDHWSEDRKGFGPLSYQKSRVRSQ